MTRRMVAAGAAGVLTALALPAAASAHGLVGKQDLPIPRWLFAWGAAVVLVVSFVGLAALWPSPRLQELRERVAFRLPALVQVVCGAIGIAVFGIVVYAGLAGSQTALENLAPTFVYVLFWVGIPFVSFWAGDVFRLFNPWRALARGVAWVGTRATSGPSPEPVEYPRWLGRWPAMAGIVVFAWIELVWVDRDDPSTLAILMLAYAAVQLIGMSVFGIEQWLRNADPFGVLFGLFARIAPVHWRDDGTVALRRPLNGLPALDPRPGTVALVVTMIGTTAFDGFSQSAAWNDVAPDMQRWFIDIGFSARVSLEIVGSIGIAGGILAVAALYRLGVLGMRSVGERHSVGELSRSFAHTLVPIALAYVVAHYFSLLAYQGQATAFLISDPLGDGSDIFGTASSTIDYGWISATGIWYVQVGALVVGHVAGLVLAHDRALALYRDPRAATRSQYWMLAVMVGFTSLGLWLLSAAAQ